MSSQWRRHKLFCHAHRSLHRWAFSFWITSDTAGIALQPCTGPPWALLADMRCAAPKICDGSPELTKGNNQSIRQGVFQLTLAKHTIADAECSLRRWPNSRL